MRYGSRLSFLFAALLTAGLAGCGGGGSGGAGPAAVLPGGPGLPSTGAAANAHVVISIPKPSASTGRTPAYVSPATQSISVAVDGGTPTVQNLSSSSPNCSSAGTAYPMNCTVPVSATAGSHTLTFITYDQPNAAGNKLSANSISVTFVAGQNPAIPVVLAGVPASFQVASATTMSSSSISGSATTGYGFLMASTSKILIVTLDADGNYIVGPGAPTIAASLTGVTAGSGIAIAPAGGGNPNLFTLASTGAGSAALALTATPSAALAGSALNATVPLSAGALVTTVAGENGATGLVDGTGTTARFSGPSGDAYDSANGNIYVVDSCMIRAVTPGNGTANSATVTTIAGDPAACGHVDGTGTGAQFRFPYGIAYDSTNGDLYVPDGCSIRQITPGNGTANSGVVTTIAGNYTTCGEIDGTGTGAQLNYPDGIAYDAATHDLYVTDESGCTVRQIDPGNGTLNSGVVITIAGNPSSCTSTDGTGASATFNNIEGVAVDSANGDLYVTDNCSVRQVTTGNGSANSGVVTTIAGSNSTCGFVDGTGTAAQFASGLNGIDYDPTNGDLYVSDDGNCNLRQVTPGNGTANSGVVTTIAGGNSSECTFADGLGNIARFNYPFFPAYDPTNNSLYVGDDNYTIRQVQL
ncbi:MAG: hypothetical protein HKL92_02470 [Candidatus Eremiobacteraeota bacterium]|nr:hypothetical protein [Candidatus Eremiobacteraeota bacterium]